MMNKLKSSVPASALLKFRLGRCALEVEMKTCAFFRRYNCLIDRRYVPI